MPCTTRDDFMIQVTKFRFLFQSLKVFIMTSIILKFCQNDLVIKDCKIALICQSRYIIPIWGLPIIKLRGVMQGTKHLGLAELLNHY